MRKNLIKLVCLIVAVSLGTIIGRHTLATPSPVPSSEAGLSAYRMLEHLNIIAAEERSTYNCERKLYIRDYIIGVMAGYGLEPVIEYFPVTINIYFDSVEVLRGITFEGDARIEMIEAGKDYFEGYFGFRAECADTVLTYGANMLFRQQGRSDTAIMLIAHIDSAPASGHWMCREPEVLSPGAADAGYGLVTMLEIARYFAGRDLENTIYYFFTDWHEVHLIGALHAQHSKVFDFDNVSMILNLEGRGSQGPVIMFETGDSDLETIRFFRNAVSRPVSWSVAQGVYRMIPNNSDLTPFLKRGFAGMNFAPLNNLLYYHTPYDSLENISLSTMQHYINQVGEMVELFATDTRFSDINVFESDRNAVFFSLPLGIMIIYSDFTAMILSVVILVSVGAILVLYAVRRRVRVGKVALWMLLVLGVVVASAVVGFGIGLTAALITGRPFNPFFFPLPYTEMLIMWPTVIILLALFALLHKSLTKRFSRNEMVIGAMTLLAILQLAVGLVMVEATFLLLIPLFFSFVFFLVSEVKAVRENKILFPIVIAFPLFLTTIIFIPFVFVLTLSMTIGSLFITLVFTVLMAMPLLPLTIGIEKPPSGLASNVVKS
ncbi:MAG: M28 family peptidase [Defluviitaleaceae bacterium]|nr:M28 family peptidase [Defluviitaleaceae bacterium]